MHIGGEGHAQVLHPVVAGIEQERPHGPEPWPSVERIEERRKPPRRQQGVVVEEKQEIRIGPASAQIAARTEIDVRLKAQVLEALPEQLTPQRPACSGGLVRGTVVDHDDLHVFARRVLAQTAQAIRCQTPLIEHGDDHRDPELCHTPHPNPFPGNLRTSVSTLHGNPGRIFPRDSSSRPSPHAPENRPLPWPWNDIDAG